VYLANEEEDILLREACFGEGQEYLSEQLQRGEGVAGRVLASGMPLVIKEYKHWEGKSLTIPSDTWGSIIQVPILLSEKVIGVLGCYTIAGKVRNFAQEDIDRLQSLAHQAAVAIENINLIDVAQQAEAKLEVIVEAAPSAIISADREQHIIMFNKAAENMFGYSAGEVMGKDVTFLLPIRFHDTHPKYVDEFTNKASNENAILIPRELVGLRANGEEFPVEVSVSKVDNKGKMILTVIMQDITLRKQTENALRNSERRAKILLNLSKSLEISQTYQEILQASLEIIETVIGYRNVWFYLYSDNRETARLIGAVGWNAEKIKEVGSVLKIRGDKFLEEIAMGNAPVVVEDARTDPRTNKDAVAYFENRSIINTPAFIMDQHLGIFGTGSFGDEDILVPTAAELDFLSAMASHIIISIDRITQTQERARAEAKIIRNNQNQNIINTLLQLGLQDIRLNQKLDIALNVILSTPWLSILPKGAIFIADEENGKLTMVAHENLEESLQTSCAVVKPGICLCGRAAQSGELRFSTSGDLQHETHIDGEEPHSHYNVPIMLGDKLQGLFVLYLEEEHAQDESEVEFLMAIAHTLAGLIDRAKAQEKIKRINADLILAYDSTLEGWAKALDLRDKETGEHTLRVAELTVELARSIGVPENELIHIWRGALLHDIGKMSIPDTTLKKEDSLSAQEWDIMRQHPQNAYDMLASIPYLEKALDIPYCHHEKWNGRGYPRGLKGEDIPLAARIFSLVDVWDALRSDRPYRLAWDDEKVITYIQERAGVDFDPNIVDAFFKLVV
jgi:PAS domain S-box-containing protein/putative nucleotidyltransferase with HDIG domain